MRHYDFWLEYFKNDERLLIRNGIHDQRIMTIHNILLGNVSATPFFSSPNFIASIFYYFDGIDRYQCSIVIANNRIKINLG